MKMFSTEAQKASHEFLQKQGFAINFTLEDNGVTWAFYSWPGTQRKYVFRIAENGEFIGAEVLKFSLTKESWTNGSPTEEA